MGDLEALTYPREAFTIDLRGTPIQVNPERRESILDDYRRLARIPKSVDAKIRRVLALGDNDGTFSAWAYKRWPDAWVDVYVESRDLVECWENYPPGYRMIVAAEGTPLDLFVYDFVHTTKGEWLGLMAQLRVGQIRSVNIVEVVR